MISEICATPSTAIIIRGARKIFEKRLELHKVEVIKVWVEFFDKRQNE